MDYALHQVLSRLLDPLPQLAPAERSRWAELAGAMAQSLRHLYGHLGGGHDGQEEENPGDAAVLSRLESIEEEARRMCGEEVR